MPRLLAVRHGETAWNREGRLQGWAPVGLNDRGREQARALAGALPTVLDGEGVDRLVTSDLERARQTARLLREAAPDDRDLPAPEPSRAFRERHLGVYQGLLVEALRERHPELRDIGTVTGLSTTPEGGESLEDLADRVRDGLASLATERPEERTVLLVTHGGPIRVLLGDALGQPLAEAVATHRPANCAVYEFELGATLEFVGEPPSA